MSKQKTKHSKTKPQARTAAALPNLPSLMQYVIGPGGSNSNGTTKLPEPTPLEILEAGEADTEGESEREYSRRLFFRHAIAEARSADAEHGDMQNHHQGLGVLLEEVVEYALEVFKKNRKRDLTNMYLEAVQIAAVAERIGWLCLKEREAQERKDMIARAR